MRGCALWRRGAVLGPLNSLTFIVPISAIVGAIRLALVWLSAARCGGVRVQRRRGLSLGNYLLGKKDKRQNKGVDKAARGVIGSHSPLLKSERLAPPRSESVHFTRARGNHT